MLTLSGNNGQQHGLAGVFIKEAKIISIVDLSGKPTYNKEPSSIKDLAIEVEFDIGLDWNKKVIFKGNLKGSNGTTNWHSAFLVRDFFMQTNCFDDLTKEEIEAKLELFSKKEIPVDFLLKARNKSVFILDYVKGISEEGKPRYFTWNIVKRDEQELIDSFKVSVAKGYPSNYQPQLISHPEKAATFEYGANSIKSESESPPDFVF